MSLLVVTVDDAGNVINVDYRQPGDTGRLLKDVDKTYRDIGRVIRPTLGDAQELFLIGDVRKAISTSPLLTEDQRRRFLVELERLSPGDSLVITWPNGLAGGLIDSANGAASRRPITRFVDP